MFNIFKHIGILYSIYNIFSVFECLYINLFHYLMTVNKWRTVKLFMKHSMFTYLRHIFNRGLHSSGHERFPLAPWQQPPPFTRFWGFFTSSTWMKNVIFALVLFWRRKTIFYQFNEQSITKNRNFIFQELTLMITLTYIKNVVNYSFKK